MPTTHLLYLHGFRSSPQSNKARQMAARVAAEFPRVHWWCPQLPPSPAAAAALIDAGTADWPAEQMAVIGSSLGGYYATWLAEARGCRAVVLNPAVDPARYLAVIAKGDELLDWREMAARYAGAHIRLLEGSDHALSDFDRHIDAVLDFLELAR